MNFVGILEKNGPYYNGPELYISQITRYVTELSCSGSIWRQAIATTNAGLLSSEHPGTRVS